jgi:hypothetical protein
MLRRASTDRKTGGQVAKRFPKDTVVQFDYLPTHRVQIAITPAALMD